MFRQGLRMPIGRYQRPSFSNPKLLRPLLAPLSSSATPSESEDSKPAKPAGFFERHFGKQSCEAKSDFKSRWLMAVPAFATHMCIGSPWAWSIMGDIITKEVGFVAPVAADWTLAQSCLPLSIVFVFLGGSAAVLGPWQR